LALLTAASKPSTPLASVRAQIMNSPPEQSSEALAAHATLLAAWSTGINALPSRCPHRLGNTWSSRCSPAAPARWYSITVRRVISSSPKPVSASAITGRPEPMTTSRTTRAKWSSVSSPISGTPAATEVAPPETYAARNPASRTAMPTNALNAPGAATTPRSISSRSVRPGCC
jgi:hypothetical protein